MALFLERRNRLIIPRWREYKRNLLSFEHSPNSAQVVPFQTFEEEDDFLLKEEEWNITKSIPSAIELVNAATSLDLKERARDAAMLLKVQQDLPKQLSEMVNRVLGEYIETAVETFDEIPLQTFFKFIGKKVNFIRKRIIQYPRNPLLWLELARLHSILGNNNKAEDSLTIANSLSNHLNRAITRACSRFYYHIGDTDRANEIIRQSPLINHDPWIMSAEISYSLKRNRFSRSIKKGMGIIDSRNFSPFEISELASMIGTIELFNGSYKSAKKFVHTSLEEPNDNSLAQAEWISRQLNNISFFNWLEKVDYAFEARAHEYFYEKKFGESLKEGFKWVIDQPFSKRAIQFSSYVASALLNDQKSAIEICTFGLRSNAESFEIVNNLIYAYALNGQTQEARKLMPKMELYAREEKHKIFIFANEGLILFRENDPVAGRAKYNLAMELASKLREDDLKHIAKLNLAREEFLSKLVPKEKAISILEEIGKSKNFNVNSEFQATLNTIKNYLPSPSGINSLANSNTKID